MSLAQARDIMCGRFVSINSWAHLRETLTLLSPAELPPNFNIAPTQQVLVAREHDGSREGVAMRWGLIPSWAMDKKLAQTNARADTAAEKPMFRSAFKKRRCLILADGYYEWKITGKQKQPYFIRLKGDRSVRRQRQEQFAGVRQACLLTGKRHGVGVLFVGRYVKTNVFADP
jgi:putative SOS response-associated peptidase YedK